MEQWRDQGIVLSARGHGEAGAVVSLLTESHGRHAGYVQGGQSKKLRGVLEPGSMVSASWSSRVSDGLGAYALEQERHMAALLMQDPLKLGALQSACALCEAALPERQSHPGFFYGLKALVEIMSDSLSPRGEGRGEGAVNAEVHFISPSPNPLPEGRGPFVWAAAYVMWELALLREMGYGIELTKCAGGGDPETLEWVSPKSGHAVSRAAGAPYKEKLLPLPAFLKPQKGEASDEEILKGLRLTGYFLEHRAFAHHSRGVPEERLRFEERFAKTVEQVDSPQDVVNG